MRKGKTAVFIDGSNLYGTLKALRKNLDYSLLPKMKIFGEDTVNIFYFTAIDDRKENPIIPLVDWLSFNGYTVVRKPTKSFTDPVTGVTKIKGNMDVEIAVMAMEISDRVDHVVLFSGDGDFLMLIEALQRKGVFVTVVSSILTPSSMIADELRRAANAFVEVDTLSCVTHKQEKNRYA